MYTCLELPIWDWTTCEGSPLKIISQQPLATYALHLEENCDNSPIHIGMSAISIIIAGFVHCCGFTDTVSLLRLKSKTPQEVSLSSDSYELYPMHPSHFLLSPRYGVGCSCAHWGWTHPLLLFCWILSSYAFPYATKRSPSDEEWEAHSSTSLQIFLWVCVSLCVCMCV